VVQSVKIHLVVYLAVNAFLIAIWAITGGGYFWPIWVILGWGLGVAIHAAPLAAGIGRRRPRRSHTRPDRSRVTQAPPPSTAVDDVAASVGEERPNLRPAAAPDGTVTMLFSDIEGSTQVNERLGDVRWLDLLRAHHAIVREQIHKHGGYEVKSQGDGFMVAFASARRAVQCAREIHQEIDAQLGTHPDGPIRLRIGLHTGEAIKEETDFYGKNVVLAARITDQAQGGEILASSVVKQLTESAGDVRFEDARELQLNGLAGTHTVYRVV
jgi:eukaryotic-like serine/threonine-protein kinase